MLNPKNPNSCRTSGFQAGSFAAGLLAGSTFREPSFSEAVEGAARRNPWNIATEGGDEAAEVRRRGGGECICCWKVMRAG